MLRRSLAAAVAALVGVPSFAFADAVVIQPTEAQSKDTFVYSFLPALTFETQPGFNMILASGRSSSGHDLRSLIQFDLSGATLGAGDIATLNLFVTNGAVVGFPVVDPSPAAPVVADVFAVTSAWDEATASWANQPAFAATPVDSETIDGVGRYVTFDVTALVQSWLANPAGNFGFSVQQPAVVQNGGSVQAVYHSSNNLNRPFLYVGPVPEPSAATIVAIAAVSLIARRRRG
jgi:hypothetical protein